MKRRLPTFTIMTAILLTGCNRSSEQRRVIVDYPERWSVGEYRNCALVGADPVSNVLQLDCDLLASETPRSRMFIMDVEFSWSDAKKRLDINWTCQRNQQSLVCRN
jgi:hypothetical protein